MGFFTNKKIWSKIIIVLIFVLLLEFIVTKPTLAADDDGYGIGGVLLSPIMSLIVSLGDGIMTVAHDAIMGVSSPLIQIDMGSTWWEIVGRIFIWIIAAAISVVIIATGIGGILSAIAVGLAVGVYGCIQFDNANGDKISGAVTSYDEKTIPDTLYLPAYTISPEEIFQGKVLLFNVNFFDTGKEILKKENDRYETDDNGNVKKDANGDPIVKKDASGNPIKEVEYYYYLDDNGEEVKTSKQNMAIELHQLVSSWYVVLRNIALVAMLSILVYIGIRISISSIASDKAKYKQMLQDWLTGIILIFLMHYIMAFSIFIIENITEVVSSSIDKKQFFSLIPISSDDSKANKFKDFIDSANMQNLYVDANLKATENRDEAKAILYPSNLLGYIRIKAELETFGGQYIGDSMCFFILVLMTIYFIFTYLKRVLYMAFLTIIAPLVAVTYPIDKMNDGSAQGFNKWFKEYIFNLLIQPLHLLLYYILVTSAWNLSSSNILYSIVALGFMIPAEKLLRSLFGFEKAQTPGMLAGPGGAALTMAAVNKLTNLGNGHGGKGNAKGEGKSSSEIEENAKTPRMNGNVDESAMFNNDKANNNKGNEPLPGGNTNDKEEKNPLLDEYDENYGTDAWDAQERDALARETSYEKGMQYSDDEYKQILKDSGYSDEEIAKLMGENNNNNQNRSNNSNNTISDRIRKLAPETKQPKRKRKLKRRAVRAIKAGGKYMYRAGKGTLKNVAKKAPKTAIRFSGKAVGGVALGAVGLAAGIVAGDPSQAFNNALAAGGVGYTLGENLANKVVALDGKAANGYRSIKNNMRQYEDLARDDYIKGKRKEYKETLIDNFGKDSVKEMYDNGIIDHYIENGVDDIKDIIRAEKVKESNPEVNQDMAVLIAKSAKRVGNDYNTPKAREWESTFAGEYQEKLKVNAKDASKAAKKTMNYITKFNKTKI